MTRLLTLLAVAIALLAPATAQAFDPATQAHPGACSQTTVHVPKAVGDLDANGVLGTYVERLGIDTHGSSQVKAAEEQLIVVKLARGATAANHGCEEGIVFPIGPRKLRAGEKVAIRVPATLRGELCSGPGKNCVAKRLKEKVVLPINCWNIDEGEFVVVVYVRKPPPPPAPKPVAKVALPSASAQLTCQVGAVVVELENGASASADASFLVNGKHAGPVAPGHSQTVKVPVAEGKSVKVTVESGGKTLIEHTYTANCGKPPTASPKHTAGVTPPPATPRALPAAATSIVCEESSPGVAGEISATLYNSSSATLPASFEVVVNGAGAEYGPLAPGQIETTPGAPFAFGEDVEIEIFSGGLLVIEEVIFSPCEGG